MIHFIGSGIVAALLSTSVFGQTLNDVRADPKIQKTFDTYFKRAKDTIERYKGRRPEPGHLIVGRIKLDATDDPSKVSSQMRIVDGGFFADAIRDRSKPIRFQFHGYRSLDFLVPDHLEPDADGVIDVGVLQMQRCSPGELSQLSGVLKLEGVRGAANARVSIRHAVVSPNTVSGGYSGGSSARIEATVQSDGSWTMKDISAGNYFVGQYGTPHLGQSQRVTIEPSESKKLDDVTLELPHKLQVDFVAVEEDTWEFPADRQNTMELWSEQNWKVAGSMYNSELRLDQEDHKFEFNYSYAPCYLTDLGEGQLSDFCDKTLKGLRKSPRSVPVVPGHVYLLNQKGTDRNVLFTLKISGPIRPGEKQPDVVAHYNFNGHADDLNGTAYPMDVRNVDFNETAIILNGKSERSDRKTGYRALANATGLKSSEFTLRIRLRVTEDSGKSQTILAGGYSSPWFELQRSPRGELTISLNNGAFTQNVPGVRIEKDKWTTLICAVSAPQKIVAVAVDSKKPSLIRLPQNFRVQSYWGHQHFRFTSYSDEDSAFCGEVDALTILNGVMPQAKFDSVMKRLLSLN